MQFVFVLRNITRDLIALSVSSLGLSNQHGCTMLMMSDIGMLQWNIVWNRWRIPTALRRVLIVFF